MLGFGIVSYTTDQEKVALFKTLNGWQRLKRFPEVNADVQKAKKEKTELQLRKAETVATASLVHAAAHVVVVLSTAYFFCEVQRTKLYA